MSEETSVRKLDPISEDKIPKFARSRKGGYIEEEVDQFVSNFVTDTNKLIDVLNTSRETVATRDTEIARLNAVIADLTAQLEAEPATQVEEVEEEIAVEPVTTAPVAVVDTELSERTSRLFTEAQEVANRFIADAKSAADKIVTDANAEAASTKAQLEADTVTLRAEVEELVEEKDEVLTRLEEFHASQLEVIRQNKGSVGYTPAPVAE